MIMRVLAVSLAVALAFAHAAQAAPFCATEESRARGEAAMYALLQWPVTEPPPVDGVVWLDCVVRGDHRLGCVVVQESASPYRLGEAALAYTRELQTCPGEPEGRMRMPIYFMAGEDDLSGVANATQ